MRIVRIMLNVLAALLLIAGGAVMVSTLLLDMKDFALAQTYATLVIGFFLGAGVLVMAAKE